MSSPKPVIDINDLLGLNSKPKSPTIPTVSQANLVSTPNAASLKETSSFIELLKSSSDIHGVDQSVIDCIQKYEKMGALDLTKLYCEHPEEISAYYSNLLNVLNHTSDENLQIYVLELLESLFNYDKKMITLIMDKETCQLKKEDIQLLEKTFKSSFNDTQNQIYYKMFSYFYEYATVEESVLAEFSNSLFERIKSTNFVISNSVYHNYLTALMLFISKQTNRSYFNLCGSIPALCRSLTEHSSTAIQCLYETITILWCFSYDSASLPIFESLVQEEYKTKHGFLFVLCEMLQAYSIEKLTRIIVMFLSNIINIHKLVDLLIEYKILRILRVLESKKYKDEDISELLAKLHNEINMNYKQLTSFELYEQEINSGFLKWGPCHTTEFFKDEIRAFEKDNFAIIKKLINIISHVNEYTSSDASNKFNEEERSRYRESIAVACYDLGEFSCYYPNGRKYCFSSPALTGLALSSNGTERIR